MIYLLDANVFIEAKNRYYAFDLFPAFWNWMDTVVAQNVRTITLVRDELMVKDDPLGSRAWMTWRRSQNLRYCASRRLPIGLTMEPRHLPRCRANSPSPTLNLSVPHAKNRKNQKNRALRIKITGEAGQGELNPPLRARPRTVGRL